MAPRVIEALSNMFKSPTLKLKLESAYIVYHGFEDTTEPQILKGVLIISSPDTYDISAFGVSLFFKMDMKTTHTVCPHERAVSLVMQLMSCTCIGLWRTSLFTP